jgi:REP element-mobilizing transposase RayT
VEGHTMPDHIHMDMRIPQKYAVASVIGFFEGKACDCRSKTIFRTLQFSRSFSFLQFGKIIIEGV